MRLTFVLGTAAELIKVYPIAHLASANGHDVNYLATGQSRDNLLMQFRDFALPEERLTWMLEGSSDLEKSTRALKWFGQALIATGRAFTAPRPDFIVVHGDTLSTLIGAIYGRRQGIQVVHIEAGLRSSHLLNPFPEEITRRLVSRLAQVHMAPDAVAAANLRGRKGLIVDTGGNTLLDAVLLAGQKVKAPERPYALVNIHRFENLNSPERWRDIVETLLMAAKSRRLVMVLHPQTRHRLETDSQSRQRLESAGLDLQERLPFSRFIELLKGADYLISDGGSNQEECSYLGKPCLLMRVSTERREGLGSCCLLSRFDRRLISDFLDNPNAFRTSPMNSSQSPSRRVLETLATVAPV